MDIMIKYHRWEIELPVQQSVEEFIRCFGITRTSKTLKISHGAFNHITCDAKFFE